MSPAERLALASAGVFLLVGLASGVWNYARTTSSPEHRAPVYVDIIHRAALLPVLSAVGDTDDRFRERNALTTWGMNLLIAGERGGVVVLVWGFFEAEIF